MLVSLVSRQGKVRRTVREVLDRLVGVFKSAHDVAQASRAPEVLNDSQN